MSKLEANNPLEKISQKATMEVPSIIEKGRQPEKNVRPALSNLPPTFCPKEKLLKDPLKGKDVIISGSQNAIFNVPNYTGKIPDRRDQFIVTLPIFWVDDKKGESTVLPFLVDTGAQINVLRNEFVDPEFSRPVAQTKTVFGAGGIKIAGGEHEVLTQLLISGKIQETGQVVTALAPTRFYIMDVGKTQTFAGIISLGWLQQHRVLLDTYNNSMIFPQGWEKWSTMMHNNGPKNVAFAVRADDPSSHNKSVRVCTLTTKKDVQKEQKIRHLTMKFVVPGQNLCSRPAM